MIQCVFGPMCLFELGNIGLGCLWDIPILALQGHKGHLTRVSRMRHITSTRKLKGQSRRFILKVEYTLWLFNMAVENDPFIDDFPMKPPLIVDFPWLC